MSSAWWDTIVWFVGFARLPGPGREHPYARTIMGPASPSAWRTSENDETSSRGDPLSVPSGPPADPADAVPALPAGTPPSTVTSPVIAVDAMGGDYAPDEVVA